MSGSSGGGGNSSGAAGGSGIGEASTGDVCNIVERVPLNSPQAAVVSRLKEGQQLTVEQRHGVVVALEGANVAGSLTPRRLVELIDCMNQGRQYIAVVLAIRGALCEVEIRPHA